MKIQSIIREPETIDYLKWMNIVNNEIKNQSDRSLALLCAAIIDSQLEFILKTFLIEDNHVQERLFNNNEPLATFSAKNTLCFYLGLISKHEFNTINMIRKIRNKFAHEILINTFEDSSISGLCSSLSIPKGMYVPDILTVKNNHIQNIDEEIYKDRTPKERFILTFKYITQYLHSRFLDISPIKRKEYIAKPQSQILKESYQKIIEMSKEHLALLRKMLALLNKEKTACQINNTDFSLEQQKEIDRITEEISILEANPFSINGASMLKIDPKQYSEIMNMLINDLEEKDIKNTN